MKKENIKRNIATISIIATLIAGGKCIAIEKNVDHLNEFCPFTHIFGLEHQQKMIDNDPTCQGKYITKLSTGYKAPKPEDIPKEYIVHGDAAFLYDKNGNIIDVILLSDQDPILSVYKLDENGNIFYGFTRHFDEKTGFTYGATESYYWNAKEEVRNHYR